MGNPIYLIIFAVVIPLIICFLIIRYFLYPIFLKPKIQISEIIKFLTEKEYSLIEYRSLNKKEKQKNIFNKTKEIMLENIIYVKSEYKIIGFSESENVYKIYWVNLQSSLLLFGKRVLNFIEEKDSEVLNYLQKEYNQETIRINDKCPACNKGILKNETECKSCGLNIISK
jgi:hypothetical protein